MMGSLIGGILIVIVLVGLMFGALAGAGKRTMPQRRQGYRPRVGYAPRPNFGRWHDVPPQPKQHPYYEGLKKNQGEWRWQ
jgi:hypothetical protein